MRMISMSAQLRLITIIHCFQVVLAVGVLSVGLYRIFNRKKVRSSRNDTWAVGVSAKSLVIIAYEVGTEHVPALYRFASLKAYMILNIIEVVFWGAAVGLTTMSLIRGCVGLGCTLSGVVIGLGIALSMLAFPVACLSILHWRSYRKTGVHPYEYHHSRKDTGSDLQMSQTRA